MQYSKLMSSLEEGNNDSGPVALRSTAPPFKPMPLRILRILLMFLLVGIVFSIICMYALKFFALDRHYVSLSPTTIHACFHESKNTTETKSKRLEIMETWIRPPSNLAHPLNDTELFWRATFMPQIKAYPFERVPKIAFMFLAKGPLPLAPLWDKFFKGHEGRYSVYVHSHPAYHPKFPPSSVFYKRQIPSQVAEWGEMSMCDAERRLLANALFDISNEWFVLLSEACIPLHNFSVAYQYISRSKHSFMGSYDEPGPYGRGRYYERMVPEVTLAQWRKGSQWFEVNRALAVRIVEDIVYYPKFRDFCKPGCYVDEHYFPTMLTIHVPHLLANRTLTWTDWSRGGAHPATFGKSDISEKFFKKLFDGERCLYNNQETTECFIFARKFAPSALDPLLELSSKVLGF
ncbi:hypothetical protein EZV62_003621 [Acer yangbiense]|uniref:Uncharacterized protein n=1 Tax=Acer yangbiense TaxID=1000413 RepID=A0A5C7IJR4_9ROSI|nr:hypothetical protein EZV62_003621 [Acer yangbiense]